MIVLPKEPSRRDFETEFSDFVCILDTLLIYRFKHKQFHVAKWELLLRTVLLKKKISSNFGQNSHKGLTCGQVINTVTNKQDLLVLFPQNFSVLLESYQNFQKTQKLKQKLVDFIFLPVNVLRVLLT